MRVLITGGTGFVGSYVARCLAEKDPAGHVILFDLFPSPSRSGPLPANVSIIRGDLLEPLQLLGAMREHQVDYVVHLAVALQASPLVMAKVGCLGTTNVFEAARLEQIKRVVFTSSVGIYPVQATISEHDLVDEDTWPRPNSMYGACKLFNELEADVYRSTFGLDIIGLRLPGVFGLGRVSRPGVVPGDWLDGPGLALLGKTMVMPPERQIVDWIYASDLAEVMFQALTIEKPSRNLYNVSGGAIQAGEWTASIRELLPDAEIKVSIDHIPVTRVMNSDRLKREWGFRPRYNAREAIREYVHAVKNGTGSP